MSYFYVYWLNSSWLYFELSKFFLGVSLTQSDSHFPLIGEFNPFTLVDMAGMFILLYVMWYVYIAFVH